MNSKPANRQRIDGPTILMLVLTIISALAGIGIGIGFFFTNEVGMAVVAVTCAVLVPVFGWGVRCSHRFMLLYH